MPHTSKLLQKWKKTQNNNTKSPFPSHQTHILNKSPPITSFLPSLIAVIPIPNLLNSVPDNTDYPPAVPVRIHPD
jgi:hypothetical protein